MPLCGAKKHRSWMARVANRETTAGFEERGDNRRGEGSSAWQHRELLVEQANELSLIQPVYEAAHQCTQIGCGSRDGLAVSRNVGKQQAADTAGSATGCVVHVAARVRLAVRFAVDPSVQSAKFDAL